ncbi:unnamed protein product, partial [Anisakis simplex]
IKREDDDPNETRNDEDEVDNGERSLDSEQNNDGGCWVDIPIDAGDIRANNRHELVSAAIRDGVKNIAIALDTDKDITALDDDVENQMEQTNNLLAETKVYR